MTWTRLRPLAIALLLCAVATRPAGAEVELLSSDSPESWAMFYFTSVTVFSGLGPMGSLEPGEVRVGLELGNIPHLSEEQRRVGFGGTKVEDLNNSPILARPVLTIGLPFRLALSLAYIPPVRIFGVQPNLFALALDRPLLERGPWTAGLRLHGQVGKTSGGFTCPGYAARNQPGSDGNPFGCEEQSDDRVLQRYVGVELSASRRFDRWWDVAPYVTVGANYLDTEFHVRARTFGFDDQAQLGADTWTFSLGAGFGLPLSEDVRLSVGLFYTPLWVTRPPSTSEDRDSLLNARAAITARLL